MSFINYTGPILACGGHVDEATFRERIRDRHGLEINGEITVEHTYGIPAIFSDESVVLCSQTKRGAIPITILRGTR